MANLIETVITPDFVNPAKEGKATGTLKVGDQYFNVPAEHVRFFQPKTEYKIAYATKDYNGREFKFVRAVEAGGKMLPVEADKPLGGTLQQSTTSTATPATTGYQRPQQAHNGALQDARCRFLSNVCGSAAGNGAGPKQIEDLYRAAAMVWDEDHSGKGPGDAQRAKQMGDYPPDSGPANDYPSPSEERFTGVDPDDEIPF